VEGKRSDAATTVYKETSTWLWDGGGSRERLWNRVMVIWSSTSKSHDASTFSASPIIIARSKCSQRGYVHLTCGQQFWVWNRQLDNGGWPVMHWWVTLPNLLWTMVNDAPSGNRITGVSDSAPVTCMSCLGIGLELCLYRGTLVVPLSGRTAATSASRTAKQGHRKHRYLVQGGGGWVSSGSLWLCWCCECTKFGSSLWSCI